MTFLTSLRRLLGYIATMVTLGIGFAWLVLDDRRQALHDKIAGTVVIYAWEAQEDLGTIQRLRARFRRWRGVAPTLYVVDVSQLAGKSYAFVRFRPTTIAHGFEIWGMLGNWNEKDPTTVVRAALVEKEKNGHVRVTEPKYLGPEGPSPLAAFKTADGKTLEMIVGETIASLPPKRTELIAIVEQSLLAKLPEVETVSEAMVSQPDSANA